MKLADLTVETIEKIKTYRFDRIVEKHEGPEDWEAFFRFYDLEFLQLNGHDVLLPVDREHHPNITLLRCIPSADGQSLTLFLKDTTYADDAFSAGFLAVCDRLPQENFFLAIVYHEWFIIDELNVEFRNE
ncbi:hypothetical protein Glo7428_1988 [Gloeocapsa sp. PCC 7428]|uniref:hypothetical protein n=1 Tax=Gloeocapsa sp. PCC 7428 TaxID=1173026 RepID=UPI0002A5F32F|nr:hypothetical protein [Gloeocapsa sp. PCC 7428]AFZ30534.1 hypothetical protein Glo7428_1988 [Gloeocapsa sp. PCC 7428]